MSYLNKHTNIVLKERKLGEVYLFRIYSFFTYLRESVGPCVSTPHIAYSGSGQRCRCLPAPSGDSLSSHHAHSAGRSQDVRPDAVGAQVPAQVCYSCHLPAAGFPNLTGRMGYAGKEKVVAI